MCARHRLPDTHIVVGLIGVAVLKIVLGELLAVDGAPSIDNVGEDEGDEQGDVEHGAEGELTGAGVLHGERRLQVGCRGVIGGVVPG